MNRAAHECGEHLARDCVALADLLLNFARRAIRWRSVLQAWWVLQYDLAEVRVRGEWFDAHVMQRIKAQ